MHHPCLLLLHVGLIWSLHNSIPFVTPKGLHVRRAFAPLVEAGFFEVVYGGAEVGTFLTHHPTIESIHLTGSAATFDAVVWGKQPKVQPALGPTGS